ncbi:DUF1700 domain-containing protein [Carnobacterium sp.]|uniref:DUF1700 domain-containing protein n=1 Tax=Carnobacterium sp. TaxID=48221 RepID=UPI002FC74DA1
MNKEHFMIELKLSLRDLDESERQDVMRDYLEHFENGLAEGKTEEQIAKELGSPSKIAKEILTTLGVKPQVKGPEYSQGDWVSFENEKNPYQEPSYQPRRHNPNSPLMTVFKFIGLGFFNLVFVLGPAVALLGCLFAGWITSIAFTLTPLGGIFMIVTAFSTASLFQFFFTILLCGVGLLLLALLYPITILIFKLVKRYVLWNVRTIFGGPYYEN